MGGSSVRGTHTERYNRSLSLWDGTGWNSTIGCSRQSLGRQPVSRYIRAWEKQIFSTSFFIVFEAASERRNQMCQIICANGVHKKSEVAFN